MRPALPIRIKLLLLALLASLPALGLALYSGLSEERVALRAAESNAAHIVRDLTMRQQQLIASTRQFQATLALLPPVRGLDGEAAVPLFKSLLAANPIYSDIVLSDAQGRILASARTHPSSLNLSQAPFFPEVLKTASFTVGGYRKSITTGLDVLVCAHPVLDSRGKVLGVISTGLRLSIFDDIAQGIQLPEGSTVVLADQNGIRLFNRHFPIPRPDLYPVGKPITLSQRQKLKGAAAASPFFADDMRGTRRLYVVSESRLRPEDPPYIYVAVSLPERTIIAQARRSMLSSLSILTAVALFTALAAWLVGRRIFINRIERLARVAARFASGDLSARTGAPVRQTGRDELDQLALAMDRIGEELSTREAEREATMKRLARTQFAVDNAGNEIYWADEQGRLLYVNRRAAESLGYTPEELTGKMVFDIDMGFGPGSWRAFVESLARLGPATIETRQRTRSGAVKPKELNVSLVDGGETRLVYGSGYDVSDRKRQEAVLRALLDETASVTGEAFFAAFTASLTSILGVTAVFIGEYVDEPPTRVRTLSVSGSNSETAVREFSLAETPGRLIPDNGFLLVREGAGDRYPESTLIVQAGIESYLGVPMQNAAGKRIGHLSIMDRRPMPDDPGLVSTLRLFAQRASTEVMRLRAERDMLASLKEKEVLLKEIHHRVKNNMQIVSSLLSLQARDVTDPAVLELLAESRARILSMALVHEDLYQSGNLAEVDFRRYLERLAERTRTSMAETAGVAIALELEEISLPIDQAIPLGLICNELLTNALKHAFRGGAGGTVRIILRDGRAGGAEHAARGTGSLTVRDDGHGLPEGFVPGTGGTLGLELVWSLAGQLRGEASAHNDGGAVFTVRFPLG